MTSNPGFPGSDNYVLFQGWSCCDVSKGRFSWLMMFQGRSRLWSWPGYLLLLLLFFIIIIIRGDPDSDLDLATSYPNSKFIAILPSNLIQAVQVDPLFKLVKQIVRGKIGRKAAKLVHYLIIYHVGDLFPVDNVLRWGYISSGQTNENLNQIISVCTCTLPRIRMIGFYIPPDLGSVLYTYIHTCIQITIRAYCIWP